MSVPTQEAFERLEAKVTELQTQFNALTVKLDGDAIASGGSDDYASTLALASQGSWDVTNASGRILRFKDAAGVEFSLADTATVTITGMTPELTQWETDGYITKIVTP